MLRLLSLCTACLMVLAACDPLPPSSGGGPASARELQLRHAEAVNALRVENGLQPVQLSARLTAAARTHARDMSVQKRAWHFGSDGTSPKDRADRAGYAGVVVGENISESYDDEIQLFQSWLNNRGARQVMLNPRAGDMGLGWFQDTDGKLWWVQMFGDPTVAPVPSPISPLQTGGV